MADTESPILVRCNACQRETNHTIIASHPTEWRSEDEHGSTTFQICECMGCNDVCFRRSSFYSGDMGPDGRVESVCVFPEPPERTQDEHESHTDYPSPLFEIYCETVSVRRSGAPTLTGIGLRTLVEALCHDKGIKGKNLAKKIEGLVAAGHMAPQHAAYLHQMRFMGNSAAHRFEKPTSEQITVAFKIIETLLEGLYSLPRMARKLPAKDGREP